MKKWLTLFLLILLLTSTQQNKARWGFFGHKRIGRLAVYSLPPEMFRFYKHYITYLTEEAVNPDARRYAVEGEAERHFIDVDVYDKFYNDSAVYKMPRYWKQAVEQYTEDTLKAYGINPWHVHKMTQELTRAFQQKDTKRILRISADLGHYIADGNVPLHTTENYNGQLSGQVGIHGFWESRLPELYADDYDVLVGKATYIKNTQLAAWQNVINAHEALDSVLRFEKELTAQFPEDKKFVFEDRNNITIRTYSREFSRAYHQRLNGQVERRFKASVKNVADFWYTAWVNAGQPNLDELIDADLEEQLQKESEQEKENWKNKKIQVRPSEETSSLNDNYLEFSPCCHLAHQKKRTK
ncbi:MAG: zinc dependent phospholipase C family protein [Thermonemataceae bacterium]|nr:zinc dependent phospholipase C family protein [Thermonemataceae bacterium]